MKRKLITTLFALSSLACAVGFAACGGSNENNDDPISKIVYTLNSEGTGYTLTNIADLWLDEEFTSFTVPATYNDLPVLSIGEAVFNGCKYLQTVTLPNSLKTIGRSAFTSCEILDNVVIPDSVETLGENIFGNCAALTTITIGSGVTELPQFAFIQCPSLTSVTLGEKVEKIGTQSFYGAPIEEIALPDGLKEIAAEAFLDCAKLKKIAIPDSVTYIGAHAFGNCSALKEMTVPFVGEKKDGTGNTAFGHIFYSAADTPFTLKSVTVTGGAIIDNYAFANCNYLMEVILPDSCEQIGQHAFENCYSLLRMRLPQNLVSICADAFKNCHKLLEIEDNSVAIDIATTKSDEMGGINKNCKHVYGDNPEEKSYYGVWDNGLIYFNPPADGIYIVGRIGADKKISIPETCEELVPFDPTVYYMSNYAFYGDPYVEEVESPLGISESAFEECAALKKVTITKAYSEEEWPYFSRKVGKNAFKNCKELTDVTLGDTTAIYTRAFESCQKLQSIILPVSISFIEEHIFVGCNALQSVTFTDTDGWKAGETEISPETLTPTNAVTLLKLQYASSQWIKK